MRFSVCYYMDYFAFAYYFITCENQSKRYVLYIYI